MKYSNDSPITNCRSNDDNAKNDVENKNDNAKNMMLKKEIIMQSICQQK